MSAHDKGAFGQLLAEAKALGVGRLVFDCSLEEPDDSMDRWRARSCLSEHLRITGLGRTGEEALRALIMKLREAAP